MITLGDFSLMALTVEAKCSAPPSDKSSLFTEVKTAYFNSILDIEFATLLGSSVSKIPLGLPVSTAQNLHARVQTEPSSIKVAVP